MGGIKRRKGSRHLGHVPYTDENMKHVGWCLSNGIGVSAVPDWTTPKTWIVTVRMNDTLHPDPAPYNATEALEKMYEYYEYYYSKRNENKI